LVAEDRNVSVGIGASKENEIKKADLCSTIEGCSSKRESCISEEKKKITIREKILKRSKTFALCLSSIVRSSVNDKTRLKRQKKLKLDFLKKANIIFLFFFANFIFRANVVPIGHVRSRKMERDVRQIEKLPIAKEGVRLSKHQ
jgi:hypothetical protein